MENRRIEEIGEKIKNINIAVYGDYCLDAYWILEPEGSEVSVETGLKGEAVSKQYYNLGGASNIVANIAALRAKSIGTIGVVGEDLFGREIKKKLLDLKVNIDFLVSGDDNFDTVVFGKRLLKGVEKRRIDFGFFNKRSEEINKKILEYIGITLQNYDVLILNQQVPGSMEDDSFINGLNKLFKEYSHKVIMVDSRHYSNKMKNTYIKTNEIELSMLKNPDAKENTKLTLQDLEKYSKSFYNKYKKPIFVTRASKGMVVYDKRGFHIIPGINLSERKIDSVGAGDTTVSALALCLASGIEPAEAAEFANLAATFTVHKLFCTGTATIDDILKINKSIDHE